MGGFKLGWGGALPILWGWLLGSSTTLTSWSEIPMEIDGNRWKSIETNGNRWKSKSPPRPPFGLSGKERWRARGEGGEVRPGGTKRATSVNVRMGIWL